MEEELYRAYITVIHGNKVMKTIVKENITPSKKFNAIRKGLYKGYKIINEGPYFIILMKQEGEIIKQVGIFIAD